MGGPREGRRRGRRGTWRNLASTRASHCRSARRRTCQGTRQRRLLPSADPLLSTFLAWPDISGEQTTVHEALHSDDSHFNVTVHASTWPIVCKCYLPRPTVPCVFRNFRGAEPLTPCPQTIGT